MSEMVRFILTAIFMVAGVIIIFLGLFGVFRFKFVMNRMHCAAMIDSLGIVCILIGLMIASGQLDAILKLLAMIALLWIGSPISSHLVSRLEITTDETAPDHMRKTERRQSNEHT